MCKLFVLNASHRFLTDFVTIQIVYLLSVNPFTADPVKALHSPYWSNPLFLIFDIWALWRNSGLDQYGAERFEQ